MQPQKASLHSWQTRKTRQTRLRQTAREGLRYVKGRSYAWYTTRHFIHMDSVQYSGQKFKFCFQEHFGITVPKYFSSAVGRTHETWKTHCIANGRGSGGTEGPSFCVRWQWHNVENKKHCGEISFTKSLSILEYVLFNVALLKLICFKAYPYTHLVFVKLPYLWCFLLS